MSAEQYSAQEARELLGYPTAREFKKAIDEGFVADADYEGEDKTPYWSRNCLDRSEPLSLTGIAKLAGVDRTTPQKWHRAPTGKSARGSLKRTAYPLKSVAEKMGVAVPGFEDAHYPRRVVVAFLKAIGYMDKRGRLVAEIQQKGPGRWSPVEPTIDPRRMLVDANGIHEVTGEHFAVDPLTRGRLRHYASHATNVLGYISKPVFDSSLAKGRVPEADGYDELERPYWWLETLQRHLADVAERKQMRKAGPEPDGYTEDGKPFRLLPGDSYYARKVDEANPEKT
ncbi:hypothetical protein [Streptomyces sp. NBC_01304]|uniref:hypothetical protein n=1 Tax=Streptomyces sp. NBC_01304 TaxID=2903818 RepID=UPI002E1115EF|nr:hypothetical protein OG430_48320 [Streptomyces sp. NBC_01304]